MNRGDRAVRRGRFINGFWKRHFLAYGSVRNAASKFRWDRGQATTEVVLLFPIFMFFLFAFAKIFALLILMQKLEIASFYAARRWQLESHRNARWEHEFDGPRLLPDINEKVMSYLGYGSRSVAMQWGNGTTSQASTGNFLGLTMSCRESKDCPSVPGVTVQRTQVWNVVTVTACTKPVQMPLYESTGFVVCSTKYVPNRDRPIAFVLPGIQP